MRQARRAARGRGRSPPPVATAPTPDAAAPPPTDADAGADAGLAAAPAAKVVQVVMEDRVTCARRDDGQVRCWGKLAPGTEPVAVPVPVVGGTDVVAIDLADHRLAAVTRDGALYLGRVGIPGPTTLARRVGLDDVIDVRGHGGQTYALTRTGDLRRLAAADAPAGEDSVVADNAVAISSHARDALDILLRDGRVEMLGGRKPTAVRGLADAEGLFGLHCAHRRSGPPVCWDARGKLSPWKGARNIVDRLERAGTRCDLASSGVACSGANDAGQLGTGTGPDRADPRVVDLPGKPIGLAGGDRAWCAALDTGALACWGANDGGQLGDGTLDDRPRPIVIPGAATAAPLPDPHGTLAPAGSAVAMDWSGLPAGCTRPREIAAGEDPPIAVASAYALPHAGAWTVWFGDFALEPGGYRPGYPVTRGGQRAVELELRRGGDRKRTQPIDRGRYRDAGPRRAILFAHHGDARERHPADVLVEKVDKTWICGTLLNPADPKIRTRFAARLATPRFRE